ncbi:hypothetical protein [Aeropyrum camini]|uniref:Uncharacterized conserved protein n=1 Tax=Aeropyrum camini SY1 = JCM 12091 TaxID=1198449 RepID=U3TG80_9CREN|nr:hypothetical protein [Aeropyrum camini]BAN91045.1 uncharacterized conserved protein [Aeropyrum camini SY1 = JCM 12091]
MSLDKIVNVIIEALEKIREYEPKKKTKKTLTEATTKSALIEPILAILGWDVRDPRLVEKEYKFDSGVTADYALKINGNPIIVVEAKRLGVSPDRLMDEISKCEAYLNH